MVDRTAARKGSAEFFGRCRAVSMVKTAWSVGPVGFSGPYPDCPVRRCDGFGSFSGTGSSGRGDALGDVENLVVAVFFCASERCFPSGKWWGQGKGLRRTSGGSNGASPAARQTFCCSRLPEPRENSSALVGLSGMVGVKGLTLLPGGWRIAARGYRFKSCFPQSFDFHSMVPIAMIYEKPLWERAPNYCSLVIWLSIPMADSTPSTKAIPVPGS